VAQQRLAMHKIKDILRLHLLGGVTGCRRIGRAVGCGKTAVSSCLQRAAEAGLTSWEAVAALDEETLQERLYPAASAAKPAAGRPARPLPDWAWVREELARRDHQVTLMLLWTEYKAEHPDGYQYSQFAALYRRFERKLSPVMRQHHRPGEKTFVDFCDGIALTDPLTGEAIPTHLFVAALGASSYTFATATLSQSLPAWLECHVQMYAFYQGVSALTIPDNLRAAVTKADRYEAELNPSYRELAAHYATCVIPARVRKPRDKRLERPALKPLPDTPYEYADWKQVKANIDYHVRFDDHFYSVPYTLIGQSLWCRASARTVELFHKGKRVASHPRSFVKYAYSTLAEHRPASHRAHLAWPPSRLIRWGRSIGTATAALIEHVIRPKPHPEQGYRSALGILRLANKHGNERLERACDKALRIHSPCYKTVKTMLAQRMEGAPLRGEARSASADTEHLGTTNVRGRRYYH